MLVPDAGHAAGGGGAAARRRRRATCRPPSSRDRAGWPREAAAMSRTCWSPGSTTTATCCSPARRSARVAAGAARVRCCAAARAAGCRAAARRRERARVAGAVDRPDAGAASIRPTWTVSSAACARRRRRPPRSSSPRSTSARCRWRCCCGWPGVAADRARSASDYPGSLLDVRHRVPTTTCTRWSGRSTWSAAAATGCRPATTAAARAPRRCRRSCGSGAAIRGGAPGRLRARPHARRRSTGARLVGR